MLLHTSSSYSTGDFGHIKMDIMDLAKTLALEISISIPVLVVNYFRRM